MANMPPSKLAGAQTERKPACSSLLPSLRALARTKRCSTIATKSASVSSTSSPWVRKPPTLKTSTSRLCDGGPGCLARPIQRYQSILPQNLKKEIRLTKRPKNKKGRNKVLQFVSVQFTQGAPVIQNTKYASLFRRLDSLIQTNVLRIQSNQLASKENLPGNILPEFCLELRSPSPHRTRQKGQ